MPEHLHCCICDDEVASPNHIIGGRVYCERHYRAINRPHPGFWRAGLIQILGMGLFSAVVAFLANMLGVPSRGGLIVIGLLLAVVPSALWLVYFYRQDRLEPEPKTKIARVFLLALLLTEVLGLRVIDNWLGVRNMTVIDWPIALLVTTLGMGFTLQAIIYFAVRLVVYKTPEYDERMDGIVYGTVAGLGVATLLNLHYIIDNEGVALGPGVISVVTTALGQASFGGLLGYFMAQAKFEHKPIWWVPLGYTLASVLNGLFSWLIDEVSVAGLTVDPWRSLVLGLIMALAVFGVLVALMSRTTEVTLARR